MTAREYRVLVKSLEARVAAVERAVSSLEQRWGPVEAASGIVRDAAVSATGVEAGAEVRGTCDDDP